MWHMWVVVLVGLVAGAAVGLNEMTDPEAGFILKTPMDLARYMVGGAVLGLAAMLLIDRAGRLLLRSFSPETAARFARFDALTYLPALATVLGAWGIGVPPALVVMALLAAKGLLLLTAVLPERRAAMASMGWLSFLFLISGFAAMIYQIVWQRTLFAAFGVNIESITIVVSLFMFGLGLGSLVGGMLSHRFPNRAPLMFLCCELGIGVFGLISLPLIGKVSAATLHGSLWEVSAAIFALLCVPTMLMGATLPILVTHLNRHIKNVGKSVGLLYCINTVGSAVACFLTVDLLFLFLGQQSSVLVAAACNFTVGVLVWQYARRAAQQSGVQGRDAASEVVPPSSVSDLGVQSSAIVPWSHRAFVLFFAAASGYISLSQEMIWMRVVSVMTGGRPSVFAHVLGFFLIGVALGALFGEKLCARRLSGGASPIRYVGGMLLVSGVFYYFSIAGTAWLHEASSAMGLVATHIVVAVVSLLLGGLFPLLCHYGARSGASVGLAVSRIYVANIVGSTLGPLLTGFVFMQYFSTDRIILGLSAATVVLGGVAWLFDTGWLRVLAAFGAAAIVAAMCGIHGGAYAHLLERIQGEAPDAGRPFAYRYVSETRSGVAGIVADPRGDTIYGGGKYDGRYTIDPFIDSNIITRAYMIAGLHPDPQDVLEVGLSSGSWSRVLANYAPVKHVTIVEINGGYLDLLDHYPQSASLKTDPKVSIHIDDGRRWLNRNPDAKFDFILQNTTFHWRSEITNLLSKEYLLLCKSHLKPGGVIYYNTTWAPEVSYTAARVFTHVVRYKSFVAASDSPFTATPEQIRANLLKFAYQGQPTFDPKNPAHQGTMDDLSDAQLVDIGDELRTNKEGLLTITDDNMATEYKLVRWYNPKRTWTEYLQKQSKNWR